MKSLVLDEPGLGVGYVFAICALPIYTKREANATMGKRKKEKKKRGKENEKEKEAKKKVKIKKKKWETVRRD